MITKQDALEFFEQTDIFNLQDFVDRFYGAFSYKAAQMHMQRMWNEGLIESTKDRPEGFKSRLLPSENLGVLRFRFSRRGAERLEYFRGRADESEPLTFV